MSCTDIKLLNNKSDIRPLMHLRAAGGLYPDAWKTTDDFRASRGVDLPDWPDWCFTPLATAYAIVSGGGDNRVSLDTAGDVGRLAALSAWRGTLGDALKSMLSEARRQSKIAGANLPAMPGLAAGMADAVQPLLSLIVYLCAANADIIDPADAARNPHNPIPKKTRRHGSRIFPAKKPTVWQTGFRLGAAIRRATDIAASEGAAKRPHIRRAHWHHFWQGPKSQPENRKLIVKWLPPIPVGFEDIDELIPTIRSVQ